MLSPLSWWNDLFFNLPIAYGFAYGVSWWHSEWFLPATIVGYWLSNILGFLMMQWGATDLFLKRADSQEENIAPTTWQRQLWLSLGTSTIYTVVVLGLIYFHILEIPDFLMS